MLRVIGKFFARCNICGKLQKIAVDTVDMELDYSVCERPMGPEFDYSFSEELTCECGARFSYIIVGSEYPVGDVECEDFIVNGIEVTNQPHFEVLYECEGNDGVVFGDNEIDYASVIYRMGDRQFELFTASVLYEMGYSEVTVTQRTRDGACDFTAVDNRHGINNYVIGECKHYSVGHKVSEDVIRKLHDAQYQQNANTAIVVTSSTFTRDAVRLARQYRMTLWDIDDLVQYGRHLLRDYI